MSCIIKSFVIASVLTLLCKSLAIALPTGNLLHDASFNSDSQPLKQWPGRGIELLPINEWFVEDANLITGTLAGVSPHSPDGMIRVNRITPPTTEVFSQVIQVIDVSTFSAIIDSGNVSAQFSILFNYLDEGIEVAMMVRSFSTAPTRSEVADGARTMGDNQSSVFMTAHDTNTWTLLEGSHLLEPGTRYLQVEFLAANLTMPEFGSSFFDSASLTLVPEPTTAVLVLSAWILYSARRRGRR